MIIILLIILTLVILRNCKRKTAAKRELTSYKTAIYNREAERVQKEKEKQRKRKNQIEQSQIDIEHYQNKLNELTGLLELIKAKEGRQLNKLENDYNKGGAIGAKVIEKDLKEYERLKRQVMTLENQIYTAKKKILAAQYIIKRG